MKLTPRLQLVLTALSMGAISFLTLLTSNTDWTLSVLGAATAAGGAAAVSFFLQERSAVIGLAATAALTGVLNALYLLGGSGTWDQTTIRGAVAALVAGVLQGLTPLSDAGPIGGMHTPPVHPELADRGSFAHLAIGRRPARKDKRTVQLAHFFKASLPAAPSVLDLAKGILAWPMYGNNAIGDCTCAAIGHMIQVWTSAVGKLVTVRSNFILSLYWLTGDPPHKTGHAGSPTDTGRVELDILNYLRKNGVDGHTIDGYADVNPRNHNHVKQGSYIFGGLYIGINLPITAQTQKVWDVVGDGKTGDSAPGSWGGHAVDVVGYDSTGLTVVTWGALLKMTWRFWDAYVDEAHALLSPDWIAANGKTINGVDLAGLKAAIAAVAH